MELRYFVILQDDGIPIFAQSYNFDSKESCISFDDKISDFNGNQIRSVINDYFQIIKKISNANLMNDDLCLFDIGLNSYRITGIRYYNYFFIGIFDIISNLDTNIALDTVKLLLRSLAINFFNNYQHEIDGKILPDSGLFNNFTEDIIRICYDMTRMHINTIKCRNCLEECSYTNNKCIPHMIFFDNIEASITPNLTKIEVENNIPITNIKKTHT